MTDIPTAPYTISKDIWDDFYSVQQGGEMNMMEHPSIVYFFKHNAWDKSYEHFEKNARTDDLTITG